MSMSRDPLENVIYELVFASPVLFHISCSSYLDGFGDGRSVAIQLLFRGCCFQDLFRTTRCILVQFPSTFSLGVLSAFLWCIPTGILTQQLLGRHPLSIETQKSYILSIKTYKIGKYSLYIHRHSLILAKNVINRNVKISLFIGTLTFAKVQRKLLFDS